ncbi:MAG: hypothetical protein LBP67_09955 [Bacteroidales bacterium]|jgi:hypothetical protein|nr:hypothetical protein [Bacteroidales bacterium]
MGGRFKSRATDEQLEAIIQQYLAKENVLKILYMSNVSTLPEYGGKTRYSNEMHLFKMHRDIVKRILENFIKNNPQYFMLKPNTNKYAVSYRFVKAFFEISKEKNFEYMNITNILRYIHDHDLYEYIAKPFIYHFFKIILGKTSREKPFEVKLKAEETT